MTPTSKSAPHGVTITSKNGVTGVARTIRPEVTFDTDLKSGTVNCQNVNLQVYNPKKKVRTSEL